MTLDRSITNVSKDKILDVLLRLGAVVKQEYNYRVRAFVPAFGVFLADLASPPGLQGHPLYDPGFVGQGARLVVVGVVGTGRRQVRREGRGHARQLGRGVRAWCIFHSRAWCNKKQWVFPVSWAIKGVLTQCEGRSAGIARGCCATNGDRNARHGTSCPSIGKCLSFHGLQTEDQWHNISESDRVLRR